MTHLPNKFDVITDLRRSLYASYSDSLFEDENVKVFLENAEKNLEIIKGELKEDTFKLVKKRLEKAKNKIYPIEKRREDLLTASCLLY